MRKTDFNFDIERVTLFFYGNLSEKDKRLFVGLEAMRLGFMEYMKIQKFQVNKYTMHKGQKELLTENLAPADRVREVGGGRKKKSQRF